METFLPSCRFHASLSVAAWWLAHRGGVGSLRKWDWMGFVGELLFSFHDTLVNCSLLVNRRSGLGSSELWRWLSACAHHLLLYLQFAVLIYCGHISLLDTCHELDSYVKIINVLVAFSIDGSVIGGLVHWSVVQRGYLQLVRRVSLRTGWVLNMPLLLPARGDFRSVVAKRVFSLVEVSCGVVHAVPGRLQLQRRAWVMSVALHWSLRMPLYEEGVLE